MDKKITIKNQLPLLTSYKVAGIYTLLAAIWFLMAAQLTGVVNSEYPALVQWIITYRDGFFVAVSAVMIFLLIHYCEKPLYYSINRYRDLAMSSSDWSWEMDDQFRFTFVSDRHFELTGVRSSKLLGHTRWELAVDKEQEKWEQHQKLLESHKPFRDFVYQTNIADDTGENHFFKVSGIPVEDDDGQFIGYRGTGKDITEQMKAESAHRESQRMLATLMNNLPGLAYRGGNDEDWSLEFASSGTLNLTGYKAEDLIEGDKVTLAELIKEEDRPSVWDGVQAALAEKRPYQLSYRIKTASGEEKWVWEQGCGVFSPEGEFQAIEGFITDISEAKNAEEELLHVRQYLSNIIDSMPSILVGVDLDGSIIEWNLQAQKHTGYSFNEAKGRNFGEVFPQLESQLEKMQQAIEQRQPMKTEHLITQVDKEPHFSDVMVYPLIANGVRGAVIRIDDVTARVRLEEMMVQTEKMLSVGGLAAGMAHEINNPLGAILQGCQNIVRRMSTDLPKNKEVADEKGIDLVKLHDYLEERGILQFIEDIRESGNRAAKIVADMLSFSRRSEMSFDHTDLHELLDISARLAGSDYDLKKKYDFKQVEIERDYDASLPEISCDKTEIEQVILNLLKNAAHAMADNPSQEPHHIILRTRKEEDYVRIEIVDNGPGMDEQTRKRIFEPFFTTKEVGLGTGLGLSVSYFIITEQHNGTMTVDSSPGKGARFIIRLPLN
jgi:PAS domain S-box-containing protein